MNKSMDASNHPTKGLCTPKTVPIQKINYIKRRLEKVPTVAETQKKKTKVLIIIS